MLDKTHSPTLKSDLGRMGLHESNVIEWSKNGIEYFYPESTMRTLFADDGLSVDGLEMDGDRITHNKITMTKADLSSEIVARMNGSESFTPELENVLSRIESFG